MWGYSGVTIMATVPALKAALVTSCPVQPAPFMLRHSAAQTVLALQRAVPSSAGGWDPALPLWSPCLPPAGTLLLESILDGFAVTRVPDADNQCHHQEMTVDVFPPSRFALRFEDLPVTSLL